MKIGNLNLDNKVFLSPMAGVTDLPFRLICKEQDCGMLYTEMVNAKALCYDDQNTKKMLEIKKKNILLQYKYLDQIQNIWVGLQKY